MRHLSYILLALLPLLASCVSEDGPMAKGAREGVLVVSDLRADVEEETLVTRAVNPLFALDILDADGQVAVLDDGQTLTYAPGDAVPSKFIMPVGGYTLHAYTTNGDTWRTEQGGLGGPHYDGSFPFSIREDWVTYVDARVPMTNYGVRFSVPDNFTQWFPTYEFKVTSADRTCQPNVAQTAYFAPEDGGFAFQLRLVNSDGEEYYTQLRNYAVPRANALYHIQYKFAADDDPGTLRVTITYDDTFEELETEILLD